MSTYETDSDDKELDFEEHSKLVKRAYVARCDRAVRALCASLRSQNNSCKVITDPLNGAE